MVATASSSACRLKNIIDLAGLTKSVHWVARSLAVYRRNLFYRLIIFCGTLNGTWHDHKWYKIIIVTRCRPNGTQSTILARRAVSAARPPTRPAAGRHTGSVIDDDDDDDDDDRRQTSAYKNNTDPLGGSVTRCSRRRETSPPVLPSGELDETYASSLILPIRSVVWKHDVIHKTGSTWHISLPSEDRDAAIDNIYAKLGESWTCGFRDMRADRQTNKQTCLSQYFALDLTGAKLKTIV